MKTDMTVRVKSKYIDEECVIELRKYVSNEQTAVLLRSLEGEPLATATVCLEGEPLPPGHVWLKGWGENEGIPEALVKAGVVQPTGRICPAGWSHAQEAELLVKIDEKEEQ